ncbi:MAG: gliding motility-associated C-terminal domain-containing protein, partial [Bacteroidales bacterium]|nr:gliding motility-associated C-terminal domain-containing protein [Bacteroidales bacterium]
YVFYRFNQNSGTYYSIGISSTSRYVDEQLTNGKEYCYRIKSIGYRDIESRKIGTINFSHQNCTTPFDSVPPCPPDLNVTNICDSAYNYLQWTNPNRSCTDDVVSYKIYYSPVFGSTPELLTSVSNALDTTYRHYPDGNLAGCYQVTAVDSFGNESKRSVLVCVDACSFYELPNVFTPNGDGINDIYIAKNKNHYVQKVDMKIYNRWGNLVFQTSDPDIKWDGRSMQRGKIVSSGVYYYVCDVYEPRLNGLVVRNLVGFIHVYSNEKNNKPQDK